MINNIHNIHFDLLEWFQLNFKQFKEDMVNSNHHYDKEHLNHYHMEGDVWTHTLMVYNEYCQSVKRENEEFDVDVLLACLLHDIGKPKSRELNHDKKRAIFYNHENISTFLAIEVLKKFKEDFDVKFSITNVLKLINWHSDFHKIGKINENGEFVLTNKEVNILNSKYGNELELYYKMLKLNESDNNGRICPTNNQGDKRKFEFLKKFIPKDIKENNEQKKNEIIVLIGLPNSGKSTYIKDFLNNNKDKEYNVISLDNKIMKKFPYLTYNEAFKKSREENLLEVFTKENNIEIQNCNRNSKNIIIDQTNLSKKSRRRKYNQINKKKYKIIAKVFLIEKNELKKRNIKRDKTENKTINTDILDLMIKNYNIPGFDEFDEIEYILIQNNMNYPTPKEDLDSCLIMS